MQSDWTEDEAANLAWCQTITVKEAVVPPEVFHPAQTHVWNRPIQRYAIGNSFRHPMYDRNGNLTDVFEPLYSTGSGSHWQYTYDVSGNQTSVSDPRSTYDGTGAFVSGPVTQSWYDENGNKVRQSMPDGVHESWTYNQHGQVATFTDFNGNLTVNQYFASGTQAGLLHEVDYYNPGAVVGTNSPAQTLQYSYTALGQQATVIDSVSGYTTYSYDASGNVTSVTTTNSALNETINYVYDPLTNLLIETYTVKGRNVVTDTLYGYTSQGQLASVTVTLQNDAAPSQTFSGNRYGPTGTMIPTTLPTTVYSYDLDGNVTKIAYANGTETDYDYSQMWNASGGIETVTNKRGTTVLSSFVYTFNAQRQKIESVETVSNVGEASSTVTTLNWTYDANRRLTDEISSDGVAADAYHNHYQYDPAGNRIGEYFNWTDAYHYSSYNTYTYNADGQLKTEGDGIPASNIAATNLIYTYDPNGSLIETDSKAMSSNLTTTTTNYGYDVRGRMTSMTQGEATTTYGYNAVGDRISESTPTAATNYLVDDNNPTGYSQVLETWTTGSTPDTTYVVGATIISQTVAGSGGGTQYIMPDGHGSTRQLTSYPTSTAPSGQVVAREDYDGFGNSIAPSGTLANIATTLILYVGQMWDPGALTYHDRAREYDPRIGRFNSFDGINIAPGDVSNSNKYLYANGNPVNVWDPSGHEGLAELTISETISQTLEAVQLVQKVIRVKNEVSSVLDFIEVIYDIAASSADGGPLFTLFSQLWNKVPQQLEKFGVDAANPLNLFESIGRNATRIAATNAESPSKDLTIASAFTAPDSAVVLYVPGFLGNIAPKPTGLKVAGRPLDIASHQGFSFGGIGIFSAETGEVQFFHVDLVIPVPGREDLAGHTGPTKNDIDTWLDGDLNYQVPR